jgi:hypothetical protein
MTPELIKKLCKYAEGFRFDASGLIVCQNSGTSCGWDKTESSVFPLMLYRAVQGWNKLIGDEWGWIEIDNTSVIFYDYNFSDGIFEFEKYQYENGLTQCEQAIIDCFKYIFQKDHTKGD